MDYAKIAKEIYAQIGLKENIVSAAHCATRLRLVIADNNKCNKQAIENIKGVKGVFEASGQLQIILGTGVVNKVFDELINLAGITEASEEEAKQAATSKQNVFMRAIKTLGDVFVPIIPAIVASGLLMGLLEGLAKVWPQMASSGTYTVIHLFSNAAFVFLPILIAVSAAKVFGGNQYLGAVIGMIMIHTDLLNAWSIAEMASSEIPKASVWFGLYDINLVGYQGHVIPVVIAVWFMSKLEKKLHKIVPEMIDLFVTPLVTVLVTGYCTLTIFGPVFSTLENGVLNGVQGLITLPYGIGAFLAGLVYAPTVVIGVHHMYNALEASMLSATGANIWMPIATAANVAQGAAALAFALRTKNNKTKAMALPASLSAFLGITEPAIFGVNIRFIRPFIAGIIGGACGALVGSVLNVSATAYGVTGVFGLLITTNSTVQYLILMAVAFGVAFIVSWIMFKEESIEGSNSKTNETIISEELDSNEMVAFGEAITNEIQELDEKIELKQGEILSPLTGKSIPMAEVNDSTFASEVLGKGIGVIPAEGKVYSPVNGKIVTIFDTKHAIGIASEDGTEILIHIGINTVELKGEGFTSHVTEGQEVKAGQLLIEFDIPKIKEAGYDVTTAVIITNTYDYKNVEMICSGDIKHGEKVIQCSK